MEKEFVSSIQTNDNQNVDGDMENLIVTSKIHSKTSTRFGSAKQITTTFGLQNCYILSLLEFMTLN